MLYGNESISHYTPSNVMVWMSMALQAGILNVGGFLACHRFVSHVTGFAAHFGVEVSQEQYSHAWGMLLVPVFFLLGSMISGALVDLRLKLHKKPEYYITFGIMFGLLLLVYFGGVFDFFGEFGGSIGTRGNYLLLILLCLVCGIQNGTVATVSRSVIRTTHLTGITTDLGLGLIRIFNKKKLADEIPNEGKANLMRIGIIVFFGLGSVIGAFLFSNVGFYGFLLPVITSGLLFGLMFYFQVLRTKKSNAY